MSTFLSFKESFKGDLVTPTDPDYEDAIERWAHNAVRRAKIVAFVKDADDVSLAIKYAKANSIPIAIRGGGHSAAGASSIEDGLVIDLSKYINGVTVNAEKRLGYVGGGAVWKTVDYTCIQYGLATVGGTVNHVSDFHTNRTQGFDLTASELRPVWEGKQDDVIELYKKRIDRIRAQTHSRRRLWLA